MRISKLIASNSLKIIIKKQIHAVLFNYFPHERLLGGVPPGVAGAFEVYGLRFTVRLSFQVYSFTL